MKSRKHKKKRKKKDREKLLPKKKKGNGETENLLLQLVNEEFISVNTKEWTHVIQIIPRLDV